MFILLDCGTELQINKTERGYQLGEVVNNEFKPLGEPRREFIEVIGEIAHCSITEYEALAIQEMQDVTISTMNKIKEWFALHSEYLVNLEQPID